MTTKIWLSPPHMSGDEQKYIREAFETNWVAPLGPNVDAFENGLSSFVGIPHVAALSSGTAAIHLALILCNVGPGDEVLVSTFTFSASANPVAYLGATPVFIDSEADSWNMDPVLLEEAIIDRLKKGKKPKAILAVDLYGMPARMDEIVQIGEKYEIPVIEDAAEALGSSYKGRRCGSFGELGILSFNGNKIITTSGGGALLSCHSDYIEKAKFLSTQARDNAPHYEHTQIGYNYRMSNVLAGIGRGQLEVLVQRIEAHRRNHELYREMLSDFDEISFHEAPSNDFFSNYWLTCIIIDPKRDSFNRESVRLEMEKENIDSRPLWKPMHLQPVFQGIPSYVNGTSENLFNKGLCLPSGSSLELSDMERVVGVIRRVAGK
ncbi:MAG: aminotransferase class I/II-fold pyridoxal phosphate-dependent enzyme [Bacteroidota bacterium]